jgi:CRISPR/Cas system-associated exonuclease Cas4 (RecB family)
MKTIRASEIGAYLYCARAWWYARQGYEPENRTELSAGLQLHERHHKAVLTAGCLRWLAYILLLAALVILVLYLIELSL